MSAPRRGAGIVSLFAGLAALLLGAAGPPKQLRFQPPIDRPCFVDRTTTRTKTLGESRRVDATRSRSRVEFRREGTGWIRRTTLLEGHATRDGRPAQDPLIEALAGVTTEATLDANGAVLGLSGFDEVLARLRSKLPATTAEALAPAFANDRLLRRERAEQQVATARWHGARLAKGESRVSRIEYATDAGTFEYLEAETITAATGLSGVVKLHSRASSDPAVVRKFVGPAWKRLAPALPSRPPAGVRLDGEGDRLVDPATLLPLRTRSTRTLRAELPMADGSRAPGTIVETVEAAWSCGR